MFYKHIIKRQMMHRCSAWLFLHRWRVHHSPKPSTSNTFRPKSAFYPIYNISFFRRLSKVFFGRLSKVCFSRLSKVFVFGCCRFSSVDCRRFSYNGWGSFGDACCKFEHSIVASSARRNSWQEVGCPGQDPDSRRCHLLWSDKIFSQHGTLVMRLC